MTDELKCLKQRRERERESERKPFPAPATRHAGARQDLLETCMSGMVHRHAKDTLEARARLGVL